uniref:Thioredoxin domain-containing protein n=1 Tax=Chromera velia CCMP2878 TaxID=1169474 RepID=A0A0G4G0I1_9ALVE|eukprot:Cvel_19593.t1-p1 / transcript=Cvel_19593.t1 / gene=Cvel_19593 / organism=Chromera_velia_CCMP2878 / gene_product=hypothetical protein / transcript_product=hypothetical protein / location=Cvel_scaffold1702:37216-39977(-) / protein_length=199 / sequence_SO=supercontig / SO=protein_coding / is_pseudo=false
MHAENWPLTIAEIDCTSEKAACDDFSISAYPTLIFTSANERVTYSGARETAEMKLWALQQLEKRQKDTEEKRKASENAEILEAALDKLLTWNGQFADLPEHIVSVSHLLLETVFGLRNKHYAGILISLVFTTLFTSVLYLFMVLAGVAFGVPRRKVAKRRARERELEGELDGAAGEGGEKSEKGGSHAVERGSEDKKKT